MRRKADVPWATGVCTLKIPRQRGKTLPWQNSAAISPTLGINSYAALAQPCRSRFLRRKWPDFSMENNIPWWDNKVLNWHRVGKVKYKSVVLVFVDLRVRQSSILSKLILKNTCNWYGLRFFLCIYHFKVMTFVRWSRQLEWLERKKD